jgi:hypothetical protein
MEHLVESLDEVEVWGVALLAGHALETSLKAYLLANGWSEDQIRTQIGHDLNRAWTHAESSGLSLPSATPPDWCDKLNKAHASPYLLRYPPTNTGIVLPNLGQLSANVRGVYDLVRRSI